MVKGRRKADLVLSEDERLQLQSMVRSRSLPAALGQRAKIVLACAADEHDERQGREVASALREATNIGAA